MVSSGTACVGVTITIWIISLFLGPLGYDKNFWKRRQVIARPPPPVVEQYTRTQATVAGLIAALVVVAICEVIRRYFCEGADYDEDEEVNEPHTPPHVSTHKASSPSPKRSPSPSRNTSRAEFSPMSPQVSLNAPARTSGASSRNSSPAPLRKNSTASKYSVQDPDVPPAPGFVRVLIREAKGLTQLNTMQAGFYAVCEIERKNPASRFVSSVKKGSHDTPHDPRWEEVKDIKWNPGECLTFTIHDEGVLLTQKLVGHATLGSDHFHPHGFEGDLALQKDHNIPDGSVLSVKVIPGPELLHRDEAEEVSRSEALNAGCKVFENEPAPRLLPAQIQTVRGVKGGVAEKLSKFD